MVLRTPERREQEVDRRIRETSSLVRENGEKKTEVRQIVVPPVYLL